MVLWDGSWVDARTLHKELKVGKVFGAWIIGRINKYEFTENEKFAFQKGKAKKAEVSIIRKSTLLPLIWQKNYQW